jgi:hypothetical protein
LRSAANLTALLGIAHAVLFLLAYWLVTRTPGVHATDEEIVTFYASDDRRRLMLVGLYLMPFAGIAFLWFAVALRTWISGGVRRENVLLSNVEFVAGILFVGLFLISGAAAAVTAANVEFANGPIDPMLARLFPQFGRTIFFFFALRMAAMFVFTTSNILRTAGLLPLWFDLAGFAVGLVLLLTPSFSDALVLVFPIWVLVLSGLMLVEAQRLARDGEPLSLRRAGT